MLESVLPMDVLFHLYIVAWERKMHYIHFVLRIEFDDPDYHDDVRRYINSKPQIKLKSFALGYWWNEIPVPKVPHFGLFFFTICV